MNDVIETELQLLPVVLTDIIIQYISFDLKKEVGKTYYKTIVVYSQLAGMKIFLTSLYFKHSIQKQLKYLDYFKANIDKIVDRFCEIPIPRDHCYIFKNGQHRYYDQPGRITHIALNHPRIRNEIHKCSATCTKCEGLRHIGNNYFTVFSLMLYQHKTYIEYMANGLRRHKLYNGDMKRVFRCLNRKLTNLDDFVL